MKNTLYKESRGTYISGSAGVEYDPGQAYVPGGWVTETTSDCRLRKLPIYESGPGIVIYREVGTPGGSPVLGGQISTAGAGGEITYFAGTGKVVGWTTRYTCETYTRSYYRPEQAYRAPTPGKAPVPGQYIVDANLGWNSRARSIETVAGPATATFKFKPGAVGIVVGLSETFHESGYADIRYAVYASHGKATAYLNGTPVAPLGNFGADTVFSVQRKRKDVIWSVDGVERARISPPDDALFFSLSAAIYAGGDYVTEPTLSLLAEAMAETTLPALVGGGMSVKKAWSIGTIPAPASVQAYGSGIKLPSLIASGSEGAHAESTARLPAIRAVSRPQNAAFSYTPAIAAVGYDRPFGESRGTLSALRVDALSVARGNGSSALPSLAGFGSEGASGRGITSFPPLRGGGGGGQVYVGPSTYAIAIAEMPALRAKRVSGATGRLPVLVATGSDRTYGTAVLSLPRMLASAEGGMTTPSFSSSTGLILTLTGAGSGLTGTIGRVDGAISPLRGLASEGPYGESVVSLPALSASGLEEGVVTSFFPVASPEVHFTVLRSVVAVGFNVHGEPQVFFSVSAVAGAEHLEFISESDVDFAVTSALTAAFSAHSTSGAWFRSITDEVVETWVINTDTGAVSRYEGYEFNSFAEIGQDYYGMKEDGLYLLDKGDGVVESDVFAAVSLGKQTFGTSARKRISNVYVSGRSETRMQLRVLAGDEEYVYAARASAENMQTQRIDTGKGLVANYLEFDLINEGGEFEVGSIEFAVVPTNRRI